MIRMSPVKILIIGLLLMLTGVVLPFLMVIHILKSTILINMIAFMSQVAGLFMGTIGVIFYTKMRKN
jgi:hypothetical protein